MRITNKILEARIDLLNEITNQPTTSWTNKGGRMKANIGNYHLDFAYGGVNVYQVHNEGGAVSEPLGGGHGTKRELYDKLSAFIKGIELNK